MSFRKLRIAWSVAWGVVAVLLCVLWVRSYDGQDNFYSMRWYTLLPKHGTIMAIKNEPPTEKYAWHSWDTGSNEPIEVVFAPMRGYFGFGARYEVGSLWYWQVPLWFLLLFTASIAAGPWLRYFPRRFSLRTLLIATTLVAVVLGIIVWMSRAA